MEERAQHLVAKPVVVEFGISRTEIHRVKIHFLLKAAAHVILLRGGDLDTRPPHPRKGDLVLYARDCRY